ncbi:chromate efflux transporter [Kallotenue papyrolyticum]|uniref:chromate efflux transporter n=1 Tax=Kallotenue papyrolyticum TaxID=1325125 RepID=UPI000492A9F0|nr:chromate efflux transporter [Kallotenue papyrolyticum]
MSGSDQSAHQAAAVGGQAAQTQDERLREVTLLALRLGFTAFGGPAAHIAMLRDEVVLRRRWLSDEHFLDLLGATNLIPGPNSTEMVMHVGQLRAGRRGLVLAGLGFILPAALIVLAFAWAYTRYGTTPTAAWLLYGVKPVIIAIVAQALWGLARVAIKGAAYAAVGGAAMALYLLGLHELLILFGGGLLVLAARTLWRRRAQLWSLVALPLTGVSAVAAPEVPVSLLRLFLVFLKVGAVLYGSGYVLLAFLRNDLVLRLGWLTDQQLLDAIAVGQFTPGPVFTTATFVGYLVAGWSGALVATVGIFLPAFIFVAALNPLIPRLRRSPVAGALLDGINVVSLGLMAAVLLELGRAALVDGLTVALALIAGVLLVRWKISSAWLVALGGLVGLLAWALSGQTRLF